MRYCCFVIILLLCACSRPTHPPLRIGVIAGPESALFETAAQVLEKRFHIKATLVEFSDYVIPNRALAEGEIDVNVFQHAPYLKAAMRQEPSYKFTMIAKTFIYPLAIYSKKIIALHAVPDKALVGLPNDPSNEGRAILLLDKAGLIKLRPHPADPLTLLDIAYNPHHLQFKELDAAQIPRVLPDLDLAVINTNYAILAGLYPKKDGLFLESKDSPYANIAVIRTMDRDKKVWKPFIAALHSEPVLKKAEQLFHGQAIPAW